MKKKIPIDPAFKGKMPSFYTRLRKGHDLDDVCNVRDTYVFRCPGVGDTGFCYGICQVRQ